MVNSKKIAQNTAVLYLRMFLLMAVSLYTSRIILEALGVSDYGIYNVVGGIVVILGFLNNTLITTSTRFITVSSGYTDKIKQKEIFLNILFVCIILSCIIFILTETIGLYFLYNDLNIPSERFSAAVWVYHISVATIIIDIISIPYNAIIIANERIKAFAYISLFDAFSKLLLAIILLHTNIFDKLILYAVIIFAINLFKRIIYGQYCLKHFDETRFCIHFAPKTLKSILNFMLWSSYGSIVSVGFTQGINILLNIFFGPTVNAARGVSVQVQNAVLQFTSNFQTAIKPQLMKSVSQKKYSEARTLFIACSKYSFFLLCILGIPIIVEADYILALWLKNVPQYTVGFVRMMLLISIFESLAISIRMVNQAEGDIKKFQLYECSILLFIVPLSYIALKIIEVPIIVFFIHFLINVIAQVVRVYIVAPKINLQYREYMYEIIFPIFPAFFIPLLLGFSLTLLLESNFVRFIINSFLTSVFSIILVYYYGLKENERKVIICYIKNIWKKLW